MKKLVNTILKDNAAAENCVTLRNQSVDVEKFKGSSHKYSRRWGSPGDWHYEYGVEHGPASSKKQQRSVAGKKRHQKQETKLQEARRDYPYRYVDSVVYNPKKPLATQAEVASYQETAKLFPKVGREKTYAEAQAKGGKKAVKRLKAQEKKEKRESSAKQKQHLDIMNQARSMHHKKAKAFLRQHGYKA